MARPAGRERTVCEACELPFYAAEAECPYCGGTRHAANAGDDEGDFVFESDTASGESEPGDADDPLDAAEVDRTAEDGGGLLGRIKSALGL